MAESIDGSEDASKAVADLKSQIESANRITTKVGDDAQKQSALLASLVTQITEIQTRVDQAIRTANAGAVAIDELRQRSDGVLKQIEEDARKANSESGFAFNAKGNAEEHAKTIAQIRGTVESTFSGLTSTKAQTEEIVQAIAAARITAESDAKSIGEAKAAVTRDASIVTAANERVSAVLPSIEQGSKDANTITAAKTGSEANAAAIQALQTQMVEAMAKATAEGATISKAEEDSKKLVSSMTDARNNANEANARVIKYEQEIAQLTTAFSDMQAKLEGLLPHATSAGLASAFHNQKARFSKPQRYWLGLFVATILALLLTTAFGLPAANDSWDAILRHFINRLPIVAPLVWLAIYAGHHYSMALRMEEDYAFKEAVSIAFEGYKREMSGIQATTESDVSPLITLCENVLRALAERPGRIYDGKTEMITPLTPAASVIKDVVDQVMKSRDVKS